jgi:hypothetical protein
MNKADNVIQLQDHNRDDREVRDWDDQQILTFKARSTDDEENEVAAINMLHTRYPWQSRDMWQEMFFTGDLKLNKI